MRQNLDAFIETFRVDVSNRQLDEIQRSIYRINNAVCGGKNVARIDKNAVNYSLLRLLCCHESNELNERMLCMLYISKAAVTILIHLGNEIEAVTDRMLGNGYYIILGKQFLLELEHSTCYFDKIKNVGLFRQ